jgi:hypothetical protein
MAMALLLLLLLELFFVCEVVLRDGGVLVVC